MDLLQVLEGATYMAFIVGALVAVYELRTMSKDRRTDMMMRLMEALSTREFHEIEDKLTHSTAVDARSLEKDVSWADLTFIGDSGEYISFLARRGLIDTKMILEFYDMDNSWKKLRPWVIAERERTNNNELYSEYEWMAKLQESQRTPA